MDWSTLNTLVQIMQAVGLAAIGTYQWIDRRHRATRSQIDSLRVDFDTRFDGVADRVLTLEESYRHHPGTRDLGKLYQRLDVLNGEFRELKGTLEETRRTLALIHEHLMEHHP